MTHDEQAPTNGHRVPLTKDKTWAIAVSIAIVITIISLAIATGAFVAISLRNGAEPKDVVTLWQALVGFTVLLVAYASFTMNTTFNKHKEEWDRVTWCLDKLFDEDLRYSIREYAQHQLDALFSELNNKDQDLLTGILREYRDDREPPTPPASSRQEGDTSPTSHVKSAGNNPQPREDGQ